MAKETVKDSKGTENVEKNAETVSEKASAKGQKTAQQSVYSIGELAANANKLFGTRQECVMTALKTAGKTEFTVSEAKVLVLEFLKKEVK